MSIRTGHASLQAPQSDDANGSSGAFARPRYCGVIMAPSGPG